MEKLVKNAIKCKLCGDIIYSTFTNEFKKCKCGECFVDGGYEYNRFGANDLKNVINLSEFVQIPTGEFHLKNKDKIVAKFEFNNLDNKDLAVITSFEIIESALLPKGVSEENFEDDFENWLRHRVSGRAMGQWYEYRTNALLSLNDCYFVVHASDGRSWDELSLYRNVWDDEIAKFAFTAKDFCLGNRALSPEFCTDGALPKCWIRENNKQYLLKTTLGSGSQALGDFLAWQVGRALGLECVEYELVEHLGQVACKCENFCDESVGFVQIYRLIGDFKDYYEYAMSAREVFGKELFGDMIVFDALIANKDRHYGNFGMLVDNESGKILRTAPIFDNGYCIFRHPKSSLNSLLNQVLYETNRTFGATMNEVLSIVGEKRHIKMLENLYDFSFEKSANLGLSELKLYEGFVRNNARNIVKFLENKI